MPLRPRTALRRLASHRLPARRPTGCRLAVRRLVARGLPGASPRLAGHRPAARARDRGRLWRTGRRSLAALRGDRRGIEGLPVRLVIAFVVGVASLSVMLNMVSGVNTLAVSELDVKPAPDVVAPGPQSVEVTVVDAEGRPVAGATVVVHRGTAAVDGAVVAETGADGTATLDLSPSLAPNQVRGTLAVDVKPPAGSKYVDERENSAILVVRGG